MERQNLHLSASNVIDAVQHEAVLWNTSLVPTEEEKELAWSRHLRSAAQHQASGRYYNVSVFFVHFKHCFTQIKYTTGIAKLYKCTC